MQKMKKIDENFLKWTIRSQVLNRFEVIKHKMGIIYKITSPSGKIYIGQTKRTIEKRLSEHLKCTGSCILLENAIKKYGTDKMDVEVLIQINDEKLDDYETKFIELYDSLEPKGYNIRSGGGCGIHSVESRKRMSEAKRGEKNHNFGKPRSDEAKEAISHAKSGEKHHFYGKTFDMEHKIKLSEAHRKSHLDLPMYVVYVKARPKYYQGDGYAVMSHPTLKNKCFTSKKMSDAEKLNSAIEYLKSA